jgi:hypothetical protein
LGDAAGERRPPNALSGAVWGTLWGARLEMLVGSQVV